MDDQRRWYRYHSLFADLLRYRLNQLDPDHAGTIHIRASQWYEKEGLIEPAVRHALLSQAYGRAATLVERIAPALIQASELRQVTHLAGCFARE